MSGICPAGGDRHAVGLQHRTLVLRADIACQAGGMPEPLDPHVRKRFQGQRVRDTKPELAIRSAVHAAGLRYRVDARPAPNLRVRADLLFTRVKVAVFVDGCFWHGCPEHFIPPKNNAEWWASKIEGNKARDHSARAQLRRLGWTVLSFWEHQQPKAVASEIEKVVRTAALATGSRTHTPRTWPRA